MMEESNRNPYYHLDRILNLAYSQSAEGKGKKRHAKDNEPFEDQQIMRLLADRAIYLVKDSRSTRRPTKQKACSTVVNTTRPSTNFLGLSYMQRV